MRWHERERRRVYGSGQKDQWTYPDLVAPAVLLVAVAVVPIEEEDLALESDLAWCGRGDKIAVEVEAWVREGNFEDDCADDCNNDFGDVDCGDDCGGGDDDCGDDSADDEDDDDGNENDVVSGI